MRNDIRDLVKAKRIDNGELIEGFLTRMWQQYHIIHPEDENTAYPVAEDTICRCVGISDIYKKAIFEYDIIRHYNHSDDPDRFSIGTVYWNPEKVRYERDDMYSEEKERYTLQSDSRYEVIGHKTQ